MIGVELDIESCKSCRHVLGSEESLNPKASIHRWLLPWFPETRATLSATRSATGTVIAVTREPHSAVGTACHCTDHLVSALGAPPSISVAKLLLDSRKVFQSLKARAITCPLYWDHQMLDDDDDDDERERRKALLYCHRRILSAGFRLVKLRPLGRPPDYWRFTMGRRFVYSAHVSLN